MQSREVARMPQHLATRDHAIHQGDETNLTRGGRKALQQTLERGGIAAYAMACRCGTRASPHRPRPP